jgi:ATP-dependent DNA helicase RecG
MYGTNERMSNQSLWLWFGLGEDKTVVPSQLIGAAKEAELIKADESKTTSTRYARYLPFWA